MDYALLKTLHIISSTILFGTGLGTAFHMWATHRRGNVPAIAVTARNVVLADWIFTAPSGIAQPITGMALIVEAGYSPYAPWLVMAYCLYAVAGVCWLIVVWLQMRIAALAHDCVTHDQALPAAYYRMMRAWFWLGWPAFIALVVIFALMIAKPI